MTRSTDRPKTKRRRVPQEPGKGSRKAHKQPAVNAPSPVSPSADALRRYEAIPLLFGASTGAKPRHGRVVFDSWAHGPAIALRDVTEGHVRRLRLKAGKVTLEILAEKRRAHWEFVARVYRSGRVANDCVLQVGGLRFLASGGGYFHWSSKHVPSTVGIRSYDHEFAFEKLLWR